AKPRKEDSPMTPTATPDLRRWQDHFVTKILPTLRWRAWHFFWRRNRSSREEAVQNAVALAWRAYLRCCQLNTTISNFPLINFAVWDTAKGQTIAESGQSGKGKDVFRKSGRAGISIPQRTITLTLFGINLQFEGARTARRPPSGPSLRATRRDGRSQQSAW